MKLRTADVERFLHAYFIGVPGTGLRDEDRTKVAELVAVLEAIGRDVARASRKRPFVLVDAAAGKGYVGIAAAKLVLEPVERPYRLVTLERDPRRVADITAAAGRAGVTLTAHASDVGDVDAYPEEASLVVALHACGPAADAVLDAAMARRARALMVVPCCVSSGVAGVDLAGRLHRRVGLPPSAPIARRLVHAMVDGRRLLRMEARGYHAEAVEIVPPTVTPYNVALLGRRVGEPERMRRAHESLAEMDRFVDGEVGLG